MVTVEEEAKAEGKALEWKRPPSAFLQHPTERGETGQNREEEGGTAPSSGGRRR